MKRSYDVIIVGAGFAGLTAAIEAKLRGKDVIVLEKMAKIGGNSIISDGGIAAPCTSLQTSFNIDDSKVRMKDDMLKAGKHKNNLELVDILIEHAKEAFVWTRDYLGVEYLNRVDIFGGHSVPRCYTPKNVSGRDLIVALEKKCQELDIDIITRAYVKDLIVKDFVFQGVEVLFDYKFNQDINGDFELIYAKDGVILATGGYGQNIEILKKYKAEYLVLDSTNKPSANNNLLEKLLNYPIKTVDMDEIQLLPSTSFDEKGFGIGSMFGDYVVFPYGIMIDKDTVKRFTSELTDRKTLSDEMLKHEPFCFGLADQSAIDKAGWDLSKAIKKGVVKVYESIEELARGLKCDVDAIQQTLDQYNAFIIQGKDEDFHKPITNQGEINNPPYYLMRMTPKIHHTMGGLAINRFGQVLDKNNDIVKGLYAIGETSGGIHGAARLGSMAVTECIVFGRIVGSKI